MKTELKVTAVVAPLYRQQKNLLNYLIEVLPKAQMNEGVVIAITSKIISISEGSIAKRQEMNKRDLIAKEADQVVGETLCDVVITVKHGLLIPTAGIDESNSEHQDFLLFPKNPYESAKNIWTVLRKHYGLQNLGIILTDSHTTPLRKGVVGIGLAHFGFRAIRDLVGQPDLYGRVMKVTQVNVLDALSTAAVYKMGETNDACPIAIITGSDAEFVNDQTLESARAEIQIPIEQDLYGHLLRK